jgi:signal transduction histidine kinase
MSVKTTEPGGTPRCSFCHMSKDDAAWYGTSTDIEDRKRAEQLLYKKSPPNRESVEVNEIIREMVALLRGEANRYAVSMRADIAAGLPRITADRVQLQQVLMNLMLNATKR